MAALAVCAYGANEAWLKPASVGFAQDHLNDVLAGILLMCWAGFLASAEARCERFVSSLAGTLLICALAGLYWEGVAPLYVSGSRADPLDLVAYCLGGMLCWAAQKILLARDGRRHADESPSALRPDAPAGDGALTNESPR